MVESCYSCKYARIFRGGLPDGVDAETNRPCGMAEDFYIAYKCENPEEKHLEIKETEDESSYCTCDRFEMAEPGEMVIR